MTDKLYKQKLISPPKWLVANTMCLTITGSIAYGVNTDYSDCDVYGVVIPPKRIVFPHTVNIIQGFGNQGEKFEQWQQHHIKFNKREYDFSVYNIIKYFQLCMNGNPNMVDTLFTPIDCVLHTTTVGNMIRDNRKLFLSKQMYNPFRGYAYSQLGKMENKTSTGKRKELIDKFGFDVKFGYHVIRLLGEIEQILTEHDLDLRRNKEQLKRIRDGMFNVYEVKTEASRRIERLDDLRVNSTLPERPDEVKLKELLLSCLEEHYGTLDSVPLHRNNSQIVFDIYELLEKIQ